MTSLPSLDQLPELLAGRADRRFLFHTRQHVQTLSFAQMHEQVTQAAQALQSLGVGPGSVVGLVTENDFNGVLADLVLMRLGCTTVHLPEHGAAQTLQSLGHRLDVLLLTQAQRDAADAGSHAQIGTLGALQVFQRTLRTDDASPWAAAETPAIIFSSGTTGRTKKIQVNRDGVVQSALNFFRAFGLNSDDLFLLFLPLSNYQQKLLIYGCILTGVDVCLTDQRNVLNALPSIQPTLFLAPPLFYESAWKLAQIQAESGPQGVGQCLRAQLGGRLRIAWSGMAPISPAILEGFEAAGIPLIEAYGMTEYGPIASNRPGDTCIGSVGRPLMPGSITIADDGEILLHSKTPLTLSYLDESAEENQRVYLASGLIASGDVGRFDEQGFLHLTGRKKELLITSSGHKIYPPEIERAFHELTFIKHVVVMGSNQPHLGLLVVLGDDPPADAVERIQNQIKAANARVSDRAPIKKLHVTRADFTPDNGMLTRNLKLNRPRIHAAYSDLVFA